MAIVSYFKVQHKYLSPSLDDLKEGAMYNISDDVALDLRPGQMLNMGKLGTANHSMIIGVGWDATVSKTEMMMKGKNYKNLQIWILKYVYLIINIVRYN